MFRAFEYIQLQASLRKVEVYVLRRQDFKTLVWFRIFMHRARHSKTSRIAGSIVGLPFWHSDHVALLERKFPINVSWTEEWQMLLEIILPSTRQVVWKDQVTLSITVSLSTTPKDFALSDKLPSLNIPARVWSDRVGYMARGRQTTRWRRLEVRIDFLNVFSLFSGSNDKND